MPVVEGSLQSIVERITAIQATVTGVKKAYSEPPDALQTAQLPAFVNRPRTRQRIQPANGSDALTTTQVIEMALYLRQLGLGLTNQPIGTTAWELIDAVEAEFATNSRLVLNNVPINDGLLAATYQGCNGYEIRTYPDGGDSFYVTLVFTIIITTVRVIPPKS